MPKKTGRVDASQDIHFPKAGIDRSLGFGKQPAREIMGGEYARTCYTGNNVRAFDKTKNRMRGASRAGLTKWINARPGSTTWITQDINVITSVDITPPGGGMPVQSQSGRVVTLVVVSQGNVYVANAGDTTWTTPTNNTGNAHALNTSGIMASAQNNQKLYIADGTNYVYYSPVTNTVEAWTATAGTLPVDGDGNKARLICTWRGRTVLSGLLKDPQNWFMSRVSDPHDFDYAPISPAEDDPVAGNNSPLGYIGDVVTGLCPYTDDVLIFFGDHTIYRMTGDPASSGGQIDLVSDAIGAVYGQAFCKDPLGNIYFMSNQGALYSLVPGNAPVRISQAIESIVQEINTGETVVRLAWNDHFQGVHVFVTTASTPTSTDQHYFFEKRTGAWWTDTFGNSDHNPVCCVTFDGNQTSDRALLIGSWDGYVRVVDPDATDDDGTAIASTVVIGPILTPTGDEMLLHEIQGILAEASGTVTWEVLTGSTAEEAIASTAVVTGTWGGGRNLTDVVRYAGHAVYLRLTSTVPWAMEFIRARISTHGKVRRRGY